MATINPIIPGFSPDPSVVRVEQWYFLVNSSFHLFPGLPIYASRDLVSWKHIGNAINRREQLSLTRSDTKIMPSSDSDDSMLATGGLYAPTIRYHDGKFYVICTNCKREDSDSGAQKEKPENFIVSSSDIWADEWSNPVYFDFNGIDPSLYFEDGKSYVQASAAPGPWTKINLFEINLKTGAKLTPERTIWEGTGGIWPEGPHIYKKNGWYYLMIAEGGTFEDHMVVMSRSQDIWGPYESCPSNPILTAKDTTEYVQCTGHCEAFQDEHGDWWGVCLAVRKDAKRRFVMGRETFITRGNWEGDWLSFDAVKLTPRDLAASSTELPALTSAPYVDLLYIRDHEPARYSLSNGGSDASLTAAAVDLSHSRLSPTFTGKRQRLLKGSSSVSIRERNLSQHANIKAGLACYKDEHRYFRIFYDFAASAIVSELRNNAKEIFITQKVQANINDSVIFRLSYTEQEYQLEYKIGDSADATFSTLQVIDTLNMTGPDFVGPVIGIFAVSEAEGAVVDFTAFNVE